MFMIKVKCQIKKVMIDKLNYFSQFMLIIKIENDISLYCYVKK